MLRPLPPLSFAEYGENAINYLKYNDICSLRHSKKCISLDQNFNAHSVVLDIPYDWQVEIVLNGKQIQDKAKYLFNELY